jgi:hypothetical protein
MIIPIPVGVSYTARVRGRVPKLVKCEGCSLEYVYYLERVALGRADSLLFLDTEGAQGRAQEQARVRLLTALMKACEPVPCPGCGHVQEHMVPRARQGRRRWMAQAALYLFPSAVILCLPAVLVAAIANSDGSVAGSIAALLLGLLAVAAGVGAVVLPAWRFFSNRRYDPNGEDVEARKELGRRLAVSREEFEKQQAQGKAQGIG